MLTADTGSDEPKIYVSRKSITETRKGRKTNLQLAKTFQTTVHSQTKNIFFLPSLKNIPSDLDDKTGLCFLLGVHSAKGGHECLNYWLVPKKKHRVQHTQSLKHM